MSFLPFDMNYLTNDMMKKAEVELGETPEKKSQTLAELKELIQKNKKLQCSVDDAYLLQFLRAKKYNVKKAFNVLQNYYTLKKNHKDVFDLKRFESIIQICKDKFLTMLPFRDEEGACILLIQVRNWNLNVVPFNEIGHAVACVIVGCIGLHQATQICGMRVIIDVKDLGLNHIIRMPPRILHLLAKGISSCVPIRIKGFHVINESIVLTYGWSIIKLVLSEKLKKRVHFHSSDLSNLHNQINPKLLPEELGGSYKCDTEQWVEFVKGCEKMYEELSSYGYLSSK